MESIRLESEELQKRIENTRIELDFQTALALSCHGERSDVAVIRDLNQREYLRRIVASSEIFRYALHIYVYRVIHAPRRAEPPSEIQQMITSIFSLLPVVPDALGPGVNLGWCLTVVGAEVDDPEQRNYILHRLRGIRSLGLDNPQSAETVLREVWARRDTPQSSNNDALDRWQDVMHSLGEGQILV